MDSQLGVCAVQLSPAAGMAIGPLKSAAFWPGIGTAAVMKSSQRLASKLPGGGTLIS